MNSSRKGRRSQTNRKKISDTTGLSLFIRQPPPEQASARARNRSAAGAMASRGRGSGVRSVPDQRSAPQSTPKVQDTGLLGTNRGITALTSQDADVDAILSRGGLRLMQNMSVYLTRDEQIIFADLSSGMAALVTGVSKVGDTELTIISEAQKVIQSAAAAQGQQGARMACPANDTLAAGPVAPPATKNTGSVSVKAEPEADLGLGTLEGALAGLLALKNGQVSGDSPPEADAAGGENTPATTTTSSPKRERTEGAAGASRSKRMRAASPPISRPRSAAGTRRSRGSPTPTPSTAVPSVAPVTTQSVPPVVPSTATAASLDPMGSTAALPVLAGAWPVPAATPSPMLPALQSLQLLPAALASLAGTLSSGAETVQPWADASKLASRALVDSAVMLPPGTSAMASSGTAAASVHAGAPPSLSQLLHASGVGAGGAAAAGGSSPELAIDSLSNVDPPQLTMAAAALAPVPMLPHHATLPASLQGLLSSRDAKTADAASAAAGSTAVARTVFAVPSGEAAAPDALASRAGSVGGGLQGLPAPPRDLPARAGSSINSLPGAVSAETAPEGDQSQNVSEGVPRGMALEYTSRAGNADAQPQGVPLRSQSSPPGMLNLGGGAAAPKGSGQPAAGAASGAAAPSSSGATQGGEDHASGRASALKQDDADVRTLQRRARNRDAARRTRMKKMMLLQGGEAKVMALVEEVQARTEELLEVKRQVAEAEALHDHLHAQLAAKEKGSADEEPPPVQPPAAALVEQQPVEATV